MRGEVFGSAEMVTMSDTAPSSLAHLTAAGRHARRALLVALASIESIKTATPVLVDKMDPR
jgi:hypothetical protein